MRYKVDVNWQTIWYESKAWIETQVGMSRDLMHVQIGLGVFLAVALMLRRWRGGMLIAWVIVAALQTVNEVFDARDWILWTGSVNWPETIKDYVTTLFWPTVLIAIWPWMGRRRHA